MNSSVAATGWCPSHPPRTTRAVFFSVVMGFLCCWFVVAVAGSAGGEGGIERGRGRCDRGKFLDQGEGLRCAEQAVHACVLPFDAGGALISDGVQGPENRFPVDVSV